MKNNSMTATSHKVANGLELPYIVDIGKLPVDQFVDYLLKNKSNIDEQILTHGAVKFRGVTIDSLDDFQQIVDGVSEKFLNYIDGNSPRTKLTGNVYTSTEYDHTQKITMHNELSYSAQWPSRLYLTCLEPAETQGETLLADSRSILQAMNPDIVAEVERKGIRYIRNLHGGMGMGPSWQDTFETQDKTLLESYCQAYNIQWKWKEDDGLKLIQPSKGIIKHETTGESVWFNQIDQFHPSHLGEELYEIMQSLYETTADFPMYVEFGDGSPIPEAMVQEILSTIDQLTVAPRWEKNEFLMVDNVLVAHGRNPYTGNRRVLVAMSK